jgi:hypothetical protein
MKERYCLDTGKTVMVFSSPRLDVKYKSYMLMK